MAGILSSTAPARARTGRVVERIAGPEPAGALRCTPML